MFKFLPVSHVCSSAWCGPRGISMCWPHPWTACMSQALVYLKYPLKSRWKPVYIQLVYLSPEILVYCLHPSWTGLPYCLYFLSWCLLSLVSLQLVGSPAALSPQLDYASAPCTSLQGLMSFPWNLNGNFNYVFIFVICTLEEVPRQEHHWRTDTNKRQILLEVLPY